MEKLLKLINDNSVRTGNKSGLSLVQLSASSGIPVTEVRQILKQAHVNGQAKVRKGINGNLVFAL